MKITKLLMEARRRRVFRGAGLYIVGSWVMLQIGDVVVEPLGLPSWSMTALLYLIFLCFPIAIFLDWRYELTPEGIVKTSRIKGEIDQAKLELGRKDYIVFVLLLAVISAGVYGLFIDNKALVDQVRIDANTRESEQGLLGGKIIMPNSVAVLPFQDMSSARDQEYFADGLADTVLHMLAKVKGLRVAARTSSFAFKGQNQNIFSIANQLGVEKILEGSVHKVGNRLRVIAKLVEAKNGTQLWSERFEGTLDDIFDIQDEIAGRVVTAMQVAMAEQVVEQIEDRYRPNMAAYDQGVLGLFAKSKGSVQDLEAAKDHFEQAIELDPDYALPYIYLAETLSLLEVYALGYQDTFSGLPTPVTRQLQEPIIRKAIRLDPTSGEAFGALASIQVDEERAEKNFKKAIELDPGYAQVYLWYARFLSMRKGNYQLALENIEKALELDPLSDPVLFEQAKMIWASGQAELAMKMMKDNVKRSPHYPPYYKRITRWYAHLGDFAESMRWIKALRKLDPDSPSHWGEWGGECWVLERLNDFEATKACNDAFVESHPDSVTAKRIQAAAQGPAAILTTFRKLYEEEPGNDYRANQLISMLEPMGEFEEALEIIRQAHPSLLSDSPVINGETTWPATVAIGALQNLGRDEQANKLLNAFEEGISGMRLLLGPGFTNGIENVEIAALRGETELALDLLERAVDQGWRFMWNFLPMMVSLKPLHDEPRFKAIMKELDADIAEQRERYYATKDQPLF